MRRWGRMHVAGPRQERARKAGLGRFQSRESDVGVVVVVVVVVVVAEGGKKGTEKRFGSIRCEGKMMMR